MKNTYPPLPPLHHMCRLSINTKHAVMAQFSRHIRPGARVIDAGDPMGRVAAACDAGRGVLVLVAYNAGGAETSMDVDLSRFVAAAGPAAGWVTDVVDGGGGGGTRSCQMQR